MIRFYKTPWIIRQIAPGLLWQVPDAKDEIYLTFDDGPVPGLTEYVLELLKSHDAEATFFCVGDNIARYPAIFEKIIDRGHAAGNHTYNHLRGWKTGKMSYLENIRKCDSEIAGHLPAGRMPLFRPPHGQITISQIRSLKKTHRIVMWDVLTYDFDAGAHPAESLEKIIKCSCPGSVVVFHDNYKAEANLQYMLPRYLDHFSKRGYRFKKLELA